MKPINHSPIKIINHNNQIIQINQITKAKTPVSKYSKLLFKIKVKTSIIKLTLHRNITFLKAQPNPTNQIIAIFFFHFTLLAA